MCIQLQRSHEGPFCFPVGLVSQRLHVKHGNRKPVLRKMRSMLVSQRGARIRHSQEERGDY